jgi:hypothetical protein
MSSDNFVKVFDVMDSGFKDWSFSAFGLIFVVIGLVIFFGPKAIRATGAPLFNFQSKWQKFFKYYFLGFSVLWTSVMFFSTYSQHQRHKKLIEEGGCKVVEGPVENFVPMPYGGHGDESFTVSGVRFQYSDFTVTDGFNNTSSHGGPINKDSNVRICYDPSGNHILRLEIRNFKGQIKDYSKTDSPFPKPGDFPTVNGKPPIGKPPWYANLFIIFYFLDILALWFLFVPYIKTYFRIGAAPVENTPIPTSYEMGKKIKLSNSILLWDNETKAIWLRPRGLNFVQVQLMIGKLIVDESRRSIVSREVRFSSGFPFIMVLFLFTAFKFFSVVPDDAFKSWASPAKFIGIAAVIFTVVGYIQLKELRRRMGKIVEDALSEIRKT